MDIVYIYIYYPYIIHILTIDYPCINYRLLIINHICSMENQGVSNPFPWQAVEEVSPVLRAGAEVSPVGRAMGQGVHQLIRYHPDECENIEHMDNLWIIYG